MSVSCKSFWVNLFEYNSGLSTMDLVSIALPSFVSRFKFHMQKDSATPETLESVKENSN